MSYSPRSSRCAPLFDRADVGKRLASLRKLQTAVSAKVRPHPPFFRRRHESDGAHHLFAACVEESSVTAAWTGCVRRSRDDEEAVDIAASVLVVLGYTARGPGTRTQTFGEHSIAVHETDYGRRIGVEGVGVVMCELLARHGEIGLNGADVLKRGVRRRRLPAARLGARRVTFTDYLRSPRTWTSPWSSTRRRRAGANHA